MNKKLLGIIVLSLVFYYNPLVIKVSKAGWFSSPLEKCMDRVIKGTFEGDDALAAAAAHVCKGANKGTDKCMDKIIKGTFDGDESVAAGVAELCV
jgi:hypothetical protein